MDALVSWLLGMLIAASALIPGVAHVQPSSTSRIHLPFLRKANNNQILLAGARGAYGDPIPGSDDILRITADGSHAEQLTHTEAVRELYPQWSPDGSRIAYLADQFSPPYAFLLGVMSVQGTDTITEAITLESDDVATSMPAWSPNGAQIVFSTIAKVYLAQVEDAEIDVTMIDLPGDETISTAPDWSPDGHSLLFGTSAGIYVLASDGTGLRLLSAQGSEPTWSPDGRQIAFSTPDGISVINADGSGLKQLTTVGVFPRWSPDGKRIAFADKQTWIDAAGDLYLMNADGTDMHLLVHDPAGGVSGYQWSPDGTRLAYGILVGWISFELYIITVDQGTVVPLKLGSFSPDSYFLDWSADSKHVVVNATLIHLNSTYVVSADGQDVVLLPYTGSAPQWSPD